VPNVSLPILTLAVREQRYSCHGCGNCCRDFTVQLRAEDLRKLREQDWETKLGEPVTVTFRGATFLRQRDDGSCIFLMKNGLCRIHAEHGFEAKPIACQLFPFHLTPAVGSGGVAMGINFACQSVLENKGAELPSHRAELMRMAGELAEMSKQLPPPMLNDDVRAVEMEPAALMRNADHWLANRDIDLSTRLDGLAWVALSLSQAKLANVRATRFAELLEVLFGALPAELEFRPVPPLTARQRKMLRQAVFTRTEDPRLRQIETVGRLRTTLKQLGRNRRFRLGRGAAPTIGENWPSGVQLEQVETVGPARGFEDIEAIDELMTRYLRASILAGRCWGAAYYGWPVVRGLAALMLNVAAVGWLARLHAAGESRNSITIEDVRAALGRVDRTAGRARWLGSVSEKLRLKYLSMDDALRALLKGYALTPSGEPAPAR
jgi:lysine-N-methylase